MNADHDLNEIGIQAILFVEDSIRFNSSILPYLFKFLLKQSMVFSTEALNEHEAMLRMRGRSKVLVARDYEEATALIDRYGDNIMGLVTDGRFPRNGEKDPDAGMALAEYLHRRRPYAPVIMESAETDNRKRASRSICARPCHICSDSAISSSNIPATGVNLCASRISRISSTRYSRFRTICCIITAALTA